MQEMGFVRSLDIDIEQVMHPEPKDRGLDKA